MAGSAGLQGRRREAMTDLNGRTALVTGAGKGLGLAIAKGLATRGAHVVIHGRSQDALDSTAAELAAEGLAVSTFAADLAEEEETATALDALVARHPRIDILVNNAGLRDRRPLDALDRAAFRALLEVNLVAPFDLVRRLARHIPDGGRIVNITSIAGLIARAGDPGYIATKGGLEALTRALAAELGPRGITVNAVAPGFFATEANAGLVADPGIAGMLAQRTSIGRWGAPTELVGAVAFLCSPEAAYVTGVTLPVDGGYLAHF